MTFNELEKDYEGYCLKAGTDDWCKVASSDGECYVDINVDDHDKEVCFDVVDYDESKYTDDLYSNENHE